MSKVAPEKVDHINVHATSTQAGDQIEAKSIKEVFGSNKGPSISALKSSIGHTFAAAGAIQTIFGIQSMQNVVFY